jgi:uncharacterized protein YndB with AHSA1/START domain
MTSTAHSRSIHIDAPVEKVFDYVKEPHNQWDAYEMTAQATLSELEIAPDAGEGSTWKWQSHLLFIPIHGTMTREVYVPNERIVDHSTTGVRWIHTCEPDEAGTTLTLEVEVSSPVPFLDKIEDRIAWKRDRDLETWLGNLKKAIET